MFKKQSNFQNFPALNFAITYGAIIFTAAVYSYVYEPIEKNVSKDPKRHWPLKK